MPSLRWCWDACGGRLQALFGCDEPTPSSEVAIDLGAGGNAVGERRDRHRPDGRQPVMVDLGGKRERGRVEGDQAARLRDDRLDRLDELCHACEAGSEDEDDGTPLAASACSAGRYGDVVP